MKTRAAARDFFPLIRWIFYVFEIKMNFTVVINMNVSFSFFF